MGRKPRRLDERVNWRVRKGTELTDPETYEFLGVYKRFHYHADDVVDVELNTGEVLPANMLWGYETDIVWDERGSALIVMFIIKLTFDEVKTNLTIEDYEDVEYFSYVADEIRIDPEELRRKVDDIMKEVEEDVEYIIRRGKVTERELVAEMGAYVWDF